MLTGIWPFSCATADAHPNHHNTAHAIRIRCFTLALSCFENRCLGCSGSAGDKIALCVLASAARFSRHEKPDLIIPSQTRYQKVTAVTSATLTSATSTASASDVTLRRFAIESALRLRGTDLPASERHGFKRALKPEFRLLVRLSHGFSFRLRFRSAHLDFFAHANKAFPPVLHCRESLTKSAGRFFASVYRKGTPRNTGETAPRDGRAAGAQKLRWS